MQFLSKFWKLLKHQLNRSALSSIILANFTISQHLKVLMCYHFQMYVMYVTVCIPFIQKIFKMKKGRDGEKVNKQDGMPM